MPQTWVPVVGTKELEVGIGLTNVPGLDRKLQDLGDLGLEWTFSLC